MKKMDSELLEYINDALGIIGGVATIIGFILAIKEPQKRYFHVFYLLLIALGVSAATYQFSINAKTESVERQADALMNDWRFDYTDRGFVFASLAFLEKNRKIYPDSYSRAEQACKNFKCDDPKSDMNMVDLAFTLAGLVKGLGTLSHK